MSNYYKYKFVSTDRLFARVQEEMRSYFSTGAVDDVLFPLWVEDCIQKFRKTYLPIKETFLLVENNQAALPDDFDSAREVWGTSSYNSTPFNNGGSYYYPKDYILTTTDGPVDNIDVYSDCVKTFTLTHKVSTQTVYRYETTYLMHPLSSLQGVGFGPYYSIQDCKLEAAFEDGKLHLIYYSNSDDLEDQLIPDNFFIQDYIRKYLVYKIFLQLFNQTTDETFNQMANKLQMAKSDMYDALIIAENDAKSETLEKKLHKIRKSYGRLNRFKI